MHKLFRTLFILCFVSGLGLAQDYKVAKAEQVLKQARAAICDPVKLKALSSLSASVTSQRTVNGNPAESEIEYDIVLPDKFRRRENRQPFMTVTVIDEDSTLTYRTPIPINGEVQPHETLNDPQAQARRKDDYARVLLSWLLMAPAYEVVEYSYAGEHKEPDGTADLIDVKSQTGFTTRLYIDQKTGRLLMLTYHGKQLSYATRALARSGPLTPPQSEAGLSATQKEHVRQTRAALIEKRRKDFEEALAKAPEVEYRWVFSDYKNVKGYMLPHHVVKSEAEHEFEEWTITSFKINPKLNTALFDTK